MTHIDVADQLEIIRTAIALLNTVDRGTLPELEDLLAVRLTALLSTYNPVSED